jgi:uncharacterized membrane protein HdeD (DUF308 family)
VASVTMVTKEWLSIGWKVLVLRGVLAVVFGIVAIVWPITTVIAFAVLWGVWALVDGVSSLAQAFRPGETGPRALLGVMGVVALAAGLIAIINPALAAETLTWILGIWLLVRGVLAVVLAFTRTTPTPRWLLLLSAALDIVLGVLFAANPGQGAVSIAVVLGAFALVWGLVLVGVGLTARKVVAGLPEAPVGAGPVL